MAPTVSKMDPGQLDILELEILEMGQGKSDRGLSFLQGVELFP